MMNSPLESTVAEGQSSNWAQAMETPTERSWQWAVIAWLVLTPLIAFVGFQQIFSTHADYDDEGYVMLSIASVLSSHPIYDETYTQYGPFFFGAQTLFHQLTGLPISHDVVRLKTLFVWWATATVVMSFLFTETKSWRLAAIGFLLTFFHLDRLCLEPGHPQEFCVLAIVFSLWLAQQMLRLEAPMARRGAIAFALGMVVGAVAMVKLNVGVFLFVSTVLLLLLAGPRNRWTQWLLNLGGAGAVVLPLLITQSHVIAGTGVALPIVCSAGVLGVLLYCRNREWRPRVGFLNWFGFAGGLALVIAASLRWALAMGTSWDGLTHGLIGQHLGFKDTFFTPAPLHSGAVLFALLLAYASWKAANWRTVLLVRAAAACLLIYVLLQYAPESSLVMEHGMVDRGSAGLILGVVGPALWVCLYRTRSESGDEQISVDRLPLVLLAALLPMQAYPTPGTQMALGTLLLLIVALLIVRDLVEFEWSWLPRAELVVPGVAVLLIASLVVRGSAAARYRDGLTALNLPGAALMKVEEDKAARLQWIANTLREEADTFVFGENACCSYYFWSEQGPPTSLNPTFWPYLLRHDEQQRVIAALESRPRAAVVHQPYTPELPEDSPLLKYLDENFEPHREFRGVEIWRRRKGVGSQLGQN